MLHRHNGKRGALTSRGKGTSFALGTFGALGLAYGLRRKGLLGSMAAVSGAGLLLRGLRFGSPARERGDELPYGKGVQVKQSLMVYKSPAELYALWRNFENLPAFMRHVEKVRVIDPHTSHWKVRGPMGTHVEWDAEVIADRRNELIGWRTLHGERVAHAGSVRFDALSDDPPATQVSATLRFNPPAGGAGAAVARLLGADPNRQVREDLERFKQFAESLDLRVLEQLEAQRAY